jgi:outer membrane lipoprotein SlyB
MTKTKSTIALAVIAAMTLSGCVTTGEGLQANVYKAGQVNQVQEAKVIRIMAILPAKIEVDNSEAKKQAQIGAAVFGAILGAALGNRSSNADGGAIGAVAGGAAGAAAGNMVGDKVLVDGVSLTYELRNRILTSTQVGKLCEFKIGASVMISTSPTETRIQPNDSCPKQP